MIPPHESSDCGKCIWLLLTASYDLFNAKWQVKYGQILLELAFVKAPLIPLLFYIIVNSRVCFVLSKIVEKMLLAGSSSLTGPLTGRIHSILHDTSYDIKVYKFYFR